MCNNLTTADWIQIIIAFITFIGVITSIVISIATLIQNSKMIESTTRPYISIFKETININYPEEYLCIKNFGTSSGTIVNIDVDLDTLKAINNGFKDDIKYLKNITLAPNQSYLFPIKTDKSKVKEISFDIIYKSSNNKRFKEKSNINLAQDYSIAFNHQNKQPVENEIYTISNTMQELVKRI